MLELGYAIQKSEFQQTISEIINRGGTIWIAENAGHIIGSSCVVIDVRLAEGISGELVSLVVSENFRGQGIGRHLVHLSEECLAGQVSLMRIRANVVRDNAHIFYQGLGYTKIKEQKVFSKSLG